jgi:hypothetical protein
MTENQSRTDRRWGQESTHFRAGHFSVIGLPINMIAGTSMGFFVDDLCTSGIPATEIENSLMTLNS